MELTRHGIPFAITSGLRFFEQAPCQGCRSFLKFAVNPRDEWHSAEVRRAARHRRPQRGGLWGRLSEAGGDHSERGEPPAFETFHQLLFEQKCRQGPQILASNLSLRWNEIAPQCPAASARRDDPRRHRGGVRRLLEIEIPELRATPGKTCRCWKTTRSQYQKTADFLDQLALVTSLETEGGTRQPANDDDEKVNLPACIRRKGSSGASSSSSGCPTACSQLALPGEQRSIEGRAALVLCRRHPGPGTSYTCLSADAAQTPGWGDVPDGPSRSGEVPSGLLEEWNVS